MQECIFKPCVKQEKKRNIVELFFALYSYRLSLLAGYLFQIFVVSRVLDYRESCKWVSDGSWWPWRTLFFKIINFTVLSQVYATHRVKWFYLVTWDFIGFFNTNKKTLICLYHIYLYVSHTHTDTHNHTHTITPTSPQHQSTTFKYTRMTIMNRVMQSVIW